MIFGETPFYKEGMQQLDLFRAIVKCQYSLPSKTTCSPEVTDLLAGLLRKDPNKRLGSLKAGEDDICGHSWLANIDVDKLREKEIKPPKVPQIKDPLDTSNFEDWSHLEDNGKKRYPKITARQEAIFEGF
jgi:serine/threonine protein kinase